MACFFFFFPFFPLHNHELSNIVKYPVCFLSLHLQIFRLENHFCSFGPGDQRAGSAGDDSISWLWHHPWQPVFLLFHGLMGTLKPESKHNKCPSQPSLLPHWYFSWIYLFLFLFYPFSFFSFVIAWRIISPLSSRAAAAIKFTVFYPCDKKSYAVVTIPLASLCIPRHGGKERSGEHRVVIAWMLPNIGGSDPASSQLRHWHLAKERWATWREFKAIKDCSQRNFAVKWK